MDAHQFVTSLSYGDAIGDYTMEIQRILRAHGYQSEIFSEMVHPRMTKFVKPLDDYELYQNDEALMLVHFSIGSDIGILLPHYRGKKMLIYHNITPYEWFADVNAILAYQCFVGREQLRRLRDYCPMALADSEYNRQELESLGFQETGVLPIQLDLSRFKAQPDPLTMRTYDDGRTNIIVVGRATPNKKLEDCLKAFAYYQKFIQPNSRLIFVGMWNGFESYYLHLRALANRLSLQEVVFTGHIHFEELVAFYRLADVLLTMSEHEGFCVPLLEAFYMNVPVLAWNACAIPFTAGQGAVLVNHDKDYAAIAEMLHKLTMDQALRERVISAQLKQVAVHSNFPFEETLLNSLQNLKQKESRYIPE